MKIAVIPARGGSKRIPQKNIKQFLDKPIIAYSIETALLSKCFDKVIVSTDCDNIASVAKLYAAEVPFIRPKEISDDFTGTNAVVKHALQWFQQRQEKIDYACCIYATAPFVTVQDIQHGFQLLVSDPSLQFAFTATTFPFPIQRALKLTSTHKVQMFYPEHLMTRSQDLEEAYHDAGQIYWGKAQAFLNDLPVFSDCSLPIIIPRYRVQDIDTPEDWIRAELMMQALIQQEKQKQ